MGKKKGVEVGAGGQQMQRLETRSKPDSHQFSLGRSFHLPAPGSSQPFWMYWTLNNIRAFVITHTQIHEHAPRETITHPNPYLWT